MSYSLIKSVFPDFEESKVYDSTLYNTNVNSKNFNETKEDITQNYPIKTSENNFNIKLNSPSKVNPDKNNTQYYNLPIINNNIPDYNNIDVNEFAPTTLSIKTPLTMTPKQIQMAERESQVIENFSGTNANDFKNTVENSHEEYLSHVLNCAKCKDSLIKQFNLNIDKIKYEETLEIISYIVFGLFILILLDSIKK